MGPILWISLWISIGLWMGDILLNPQRQIHHTRSSRCKRQGPWSQGNASDSWAAPQIATGVGGILWLCWITRGLPSKFGDFIKSANFINMGLYVFYCFLFPPKSQFYGLSFVIMFPIQIDIMAIPYARVFFWRPHYSESPTTHFASSSTNSLVETNGSSESLGFSEFATWNIMKYVLWNIFFHWMWRDFPIESFISLFPQRNDAPGVSPCSISAGYYASLKSRLRSTTCVVWDLSRPGDVADVAAGHGSALGS